MRDLRNDRMRRAGVREERLRATAGLRSSSTLSSWRGRSGRRYIVGVHPLNEAELLEVTDAVILAVKRDRTGNGIVVDATMAGPGTRAQPPVGVRAHPEAQLIGRMRVARSSL